jgi:hypothetical protein
MKRKSFEQQEPGSPDNISNQPHAGLLTRKQVAAQLQTCVHTVARNKQLTPIKFSARLVRYRAADVERFIQMADTGGK